MQEWAKNLHTYVQSNQSINNSNSKIESMYQAQELVMSLSIKSLISSKVYKDMNEMTDLLQLESK